MRKIFILIGLIATCSAHTFSQDLGQWQVYPSYSTVNGISVDGDAIYSATLGGVFIIEGGEITQKVSTMDGLYRSNPTTIIYDEENEAVLTGYIDGTLDVIDLSDYSVTMLGDIRRVSRFNSRTINAFKIYEGSLYVATSFGIVVYDLGQLLVENSFVNLGTFNTGTAVNDLDISQDTIYAATEEGVAIGALSDNLSESDNWTSFNQADGLRNIVEQIAWFNGSVYALSQDSVYRRQNESWGLDASFDNGQIQVITRSPDAGRLAISTNTELTILNDQGTEETLALNLESTVTDIQIGSEKIYIGTSNEGVFVLEDIDASAQNYLPTGPYLNFFNNMVTDGETLVATSSGEFPGFDPLNPVRGYFIYEEDNWRNYNRNTNQVLDDHRVGNIYSISQTDSAYFMGSWGRGIVKHKKSNDEVTVYNRSNSQLVGLGSNPDFVVIGGLDSDTENNIWATSYLSEFPLNVQMAGSEEWIRFRGLSGGDHYYKLFIDSHDQKWISLISSSNRGLGLLIIDTGDPEVEEDDESIKLTSSADNGNLPNEKVNTIVEDKNREVWIGTDRGIARFIFPELITEGGANERQAQWLINEDTTASSRYLLRDVNVTAMAVNDANQKWIGSRGQGLWLLNEEGSRIEKRFTTENSDLISDNIESIAINNVTGQVFIATDLGLVSYQDVPQSPVNNMDKLKVFPNPFEYARHSQIVIEGLSESTQIKVLGVDGVVVNELEATGGRVSWNGRDYNGNQLGSGVYYVVAYESSGRERGVGKVVIVR